VGNPSTVSSPGQSLAESRSILTAARSRGIAALCCLCAALLPFTSPVQWLDHKLLDAGQRVLQAFAPHEAGIEVVVIGIDDATLRAFPEPLALWHLRLSTLFSALSEAAPRAVGLDVELPDRSLAFIQPELDRTLLRALSQLARAQPLVIARGLDRDGRLKPVFVPYLTVLGADGSALAALEVDPDAIVRRLTPRLGNSEGSIETFSSLLARRLGRTPTAGLIDYSVGPRFSYLPLVEVHAWAVAGDKPRLRAALLDKVVLIGSVLPFEDRHRAPVQLADWEDADTVPGVLLHAQALRTLLGPGPIRPVALPWVMLLAALASLLWFGGRRPAVGLALLALVALALAASALLLLHRQWWLPIGGALLGAGLATGARLFTQAWLSHRERHWLRRAFAGAVSPNVLDLIVSGQLQAGTGSGRRTLCVMFGDIRDFTRLTERSEPEEVVDLLNRYFSQVTAAVHRHQGTIDNFRGDGIMCMFGAPQPSADPAQEGFSAARDILTGIDQLNAELVAQSRPAIAIGLGLALGEAVVGRVGSAERNEYTAIGDCANVAARLEGLTRELGYPVLVNNHVASALQPGIAFDDLGYHALKGHAPVQVFGWPARATGVPPEARVANAEVSR
jgi:adenylate cyclase